VTLTLDRVILHTVIHHSSTSTYIPNFTEIKETFCGRTDGRTFETHFIRSTRRSQRNKCHPIKRMARYLFHFACIDHKHHVVNGDTRLRYVCRQNLTKKHKTKTSSIIGNTHSQHYHDDDASNVDSSASLFTDNTSNLCVVTCCVLSLASLQSSSANCYKLIPLRHGTNHVMTTTRQPVTC